MNAQPSPEVNRDPACPICGQPNDCAIASSGNPAEPCWCAAVKFSAEAISRIPEEKRGKSCICRHCASPTQR